ncbi:hypothetical protein OEB99_16720 [Actinotalea sp. M2MS4P-6]|uniref:hypothetical protein n=1 Tax=Actinotalea sp. M2MS4P-6 TaxID=2983762 RepID=UPI0021E40FBF|nr:hypothetical protein [Actinotalea sp. M2MS4P-6]MCV2395961.1 hypothetical protein [Actinotalea sp. M2MS4P-6]
MGRVTSSLRAERDRVEGARTTKGIARGVGLGLAWVWLPLLVALVWLWLTGQLDAWLAGWFG